MFHTKWERESNVSNLITQTGPDSTDAGSAACIKVLNYDSSDYIGFTDFLNHGLELRFV